MYGHTSKQYVFRSCNTSTFNTMHLDENPLTCQCKKRRQKSLKVSNFTLLWIVFKWHGSEVVKGLGICQPTVHISNAHDVTCASNTEGLLDYLQLQQVLAWTETSKAGLKYGTAMQDLKAEIGFTDKKSNNGMQSKPCTMDSSQNNWALIRKAVMWAIKNMHNG